MRVLVYGLRGVGIETCKNLALQGAGAITLVDSETAQMKDTGCNFFIFEDDVKQKNMRADACAPRLRELNPICEVNVASALTDDLIKSHSAVVITQFLPLPELVRIDKFCSENGVSFFYSFISGVNSTLFVNHGPNHVVHDPDGEKPLQKMIVEITPLDDDECLVRYDTPEGELPVAIDGGDYEVTEVEGCDGINGLLFPTSHPWKDPVKTLRIPFNISSLPKYSIGGTLTQKKLPRHHPMQPLSELVVNPGMPVMTDLLAFTEMQQHVAFVAISTFAEEQVCDVD